MSFVTLHIGGLATKKVCPFDFSSKKKFNLPFAVLGKQLMLNHILQGFESPCPLPDLGCDVAWKEKLKAKLH